MRCTFVCLDEFAVLNFSWWSPCIEKKEKKKKKSCERGSFWGPWPPKLHPNSVGVNANKILNLKEETVRDTFALILRGIIFWGIVNWTQKSVIWLVCISILCVGQTWCGVEIMAVWRHLPLPLATCIKNRLKAWLMSNSEGLRVGSPINNLNKKKKICSLPFYKAIAQAFQQNPIRYRCTGSLPGSEACLDHFIRWISL